MKTSSQLLPIISVFFATFYASQSSAQAVSGKIENFKLDSCGKKSCVRIQSPKASVGAFDGSFGSSSAKIVITDKSSGGIKTFIADDIYFDQSANKLLIRSVEGEPNSEYYFDLWTEQLHRFSI